MSANKLLLMVSVCLLSEISFAMKHPGVHQQRRVSHGIQRTDSMLPPPREISPFERGIEKALSEIMKIRSRIACGSIAIRTRSDFISNVMIPIDNTVTICLNNKTETQRYCDRLQRMAENLQRNNPEAIALKKLKERNAAGQTLLRICDFFRRCQQDPNFSRNSLNGLAHIFGIKCPAK